MAKKRIYIHNPFQRAVEFLFVLFIITILLSIAVTSYHRPLETAKLCQVFGATFEKMRMDMMVSHALHGDWPENEQDAKRDGWAEEYHSEYSGAFIKAAAIEDGAIHFQLLLNRNQGLKTLTMRPAVPANDTLGPVVWICGKPASPALWSLPGIDKTNVDYRYIPMSWR